MRDFSENLEKRPASSDFWKAPFRWVQRCPSYIELTVGEFDSCVAMVTSAGLSSKSNFIKRAVSISSRERRVRSRLTSRVISQMERLLASGTEDKYMYLMLEVGKRVCATPNEFCAHS